MPPGQTVPRPIAGADPVPADTSATVRIGRLLRPFALLLILLLAALLLRHLHGGAAGLLPAADSLRRGVGGRLLFLLAGTLVCTVGLPRQAVCFAAGIAYGLWVGVALALLATVLGALCGFLWARLAGRGWALRRLRRGGGGWLARLERRVRARPFATILSVRLLPVGSALMLNLAAGVLRLPVVPFLLATVLGSLPQTVVFVLLGSGSRIGHGAQVVIALALFAASGLVGLSLLRRAPLAAAEPAVALVEPGRTA